MLVLTASGHSQFLQGDAHDSSGRRQLPCGFWVVVKLKGAARKANMHMKWLGNPILSTHNNKLCFNR